MLFRSDLHHLRSIALMLLSTRFEVEILGPPQLREAALEVAASATRLASGVAR